MAELDKKLLLEVRKADATVESVQKLIDDGADIHSRDNGGYTT